MTWIIPFPVGIDATISDPFTKVLSPFIDFEGLKKDPDKKILNRYNDDWTNLIFVGRITPNKKIEDVIKVFYYYKNTINPKSRLFIVGSFVGMEKYCSYLRALTLELNLQNVILTGHVTTEELVAYYQLSNVFVCMSEHEGFCVPLVESMYFNIPIIAFNSTAIPYTLDGTGVLVNKKNFYMIAELIDIVLRDENYRGKIVNEQKRKFNDFSHSAISEMLKDLVESFEWFILYYIVLIFRKGCCGVFLMFRLFLFCSHLLPWVF